MIYALLLIDPQAVDPSGDTLLCVFLMGIALGILIGTKLSITKRPK